MTQGLTGDDGTTLALLGLDRVRFTAPVRFGDTEAVCTYGTSVLMRRRQA